MLKLLDKISNKAFESNRNTASFEKDFYATKINKLNGELLDLNEYKGIYVLIVNTDSQCGFTGQYKALETLSQKYKEKLVVIGAPCNQFGSQEPGAAEQISDFCALNYGVSFIMTEKIEVKGSGLHQLYSWLTQKQLNGKKSSSVKWNFQKYLVGPKGKLIDFYYSTTSPLSKKITKHFS